MTTLSDLRPFATSGELTVDSLLGDGPNWNILTPDPGNVLYFTFADTGVHSAAVSGIGPFNGDQQAAAREALDYVSTVTGIAFQETADPQQAHFGFYSGDILLGPSISGQAYWSSQYSYSGDDVTSYDIAASVYLDDNEFAGANGDPTPGGQGYETLLHEIGHALGLKHPFEGSTTLPAGEDNTNNTIMSYTHAGDYKAAFQAYDLAALTWIYGGDGLRGEYGINSAEGPTLSPDSGGNGAPTIAGSMLAETLFGTDQAETLAGYGGDDTLIGAGGDDRIDGGEGIDTARYTGTLGDYALSGEGDGWSVMDLRSLTPDGTDTLVSVERLAFDDGSLALDLEGNAGMVARTLGAVFGPASVANPDFVAIGLDLADGGMGFEALVDVALQARLGAGYGTAAAVNLLYANLVGAAPGPAALDYWVGTVESGRYDLASLGVMAAELELNAANVDLAGLAATGLVFA